jgi:hypothetical protein
MKVYQIDAVDFNGMCIVYRDVRWEVLGSGNQWSLTSALRELGFILAVSSQSEISPTKLRDPNFATEQSALASY